MNMKEKLPASPEKATTENPNFQISKYSKTYGKHNQQEINDNEILTSLQVMKKPSMHPNQRFVTTPPETPLHHL